jgi:hypothetical protein
MWRQIQSPRCWELFNVRQVWSPKYQSGLLYHITVRICWKLSIFRVGTVEVKTDINILRVSPEGLRIHRALLPLIVLHGLVLLWHGGNCVFIIRDVFIGIIDWKSCIVKLWHVSVGYYLCFGPKLSFLIQALVLFCRILRFSGFCIFWYSGQMGEFTKLV